MERARAARWRAALVACAFGVGCGGGEPPSILLISIDTLRRDHVSAYGYARPTTPHLDRLAREGARFENAVSVTNWTLPAHMSLLTGLAPWTHGVQEERDGLPEDVPTLAEALQDGGYATAGFASHVYLGARYGFDRGFGTYRVRPRQRAAAVTRQAIDWLEDAGDDRFFLFLHYFDPHWDFDPPPPFDARFAEPGARGAGRMLTLFRYQDPAVPMPDSIRAAAAALYDGEIAYTDHQIGRVLEWLEERGRLNGTIVAVVSDHGEEFGEHDGFGHGTHLHAEVTDVPLLIRYPDRVPAGSLRPEPATLSDLPATLLALAALPGAEPFEREGVALLADGPADRPLFLESTRLGPRRVALVRGRHKLVGGVRFQPIVMEHGADGPAPVKLPAVERPPALYDRASDPLEQRNLLDGGAAPPDGPGAALRAELRAFVARTAHGVQLACEAGAGAVHGTLELEGALRDEAYALPGAWLRTQDAGPRRIALTIEPRGAPASLVLPVRPGARRVRLALTGASGARLEGAWSLAGGALDPVETGSATLPCRLSRGGDAPATGDVLLGPQERARLRALGYVE